MTRSEVIARLRAADEKCDTEAHHAGSQAGRAWAAKFASSDQLRRMEAAEGDDRFTLIGFAELVGGDTPYNHREAAEFVSEMTSGAVTGKETEAFLARYLTGFFEGASDLWCDVKNEI